jgi:hypothetical protein
MFNIDETCHPRHGAGRKQKMYSTGRGFKLEDVSNLLLLFALRLVSRTVGQYVALADFILRHPRYWGGILGDSVNTPTMTAVNSLAPPDYYSAKTCA